MFVSYLQTIYVHTNCTDEEWQENDFEEEEKLSMNFQEITCFSSTCDAKGKEKMVFVIFLNIK